MAVATESIKAKPQVTTSREVSTPVDRILNWIAYVVLTLVALAMFIPFMFSVSTSLKTNREASFHFRSGECFGPPTPPLRHIARCSTRTSSAGS